MYIGTCGVGVDSSLSTQPWTLETKPNIWIKMVNFVIFLKPNNTLITGFSFSNTPFHSGRYRWWRTLNKEQILRIFKTKMSKKNNLNGCVGGKMRQTHEQVKSKVNDWASVNGSISQCRFTLYSLWALTCCLTLHKLHMKVFEQQRIHFSSNTLKTSYHNDSHALSYVCLLFMIV